MLFCKVLSCFELFTSNLTKNCWVALSSCIAWTLFDASVWGVSLGLQMPPLLLYRAQTWMLSGDCSAGSIFRLVPSGLVVSLGSLSEGFEARAVALLKIILWQSSAQTGGVCMYVCVWTQCLQAVPSFTWLISDTPRSCRPGQLPHTWQPPGDCKPPIDHPQRAQSWLWVLRQGSSTLEKAINQGECQWLLSAHLRGLGLGKQHWSNRHWMPGSFSHYITTGASTKAIWVAQGSVLWKTILLWWLIQAFI